MKNNKKKGFTLTELIVVLVIMAIILAIGIPSAFYYIKKAEFRKNEANAKTVYMAAETMLTNYRSSNQWEDFREDVIRGGMENTSFSDERAGRIYGITLDRGAYSRESDNLVCRLLDDLTYDSDMLSSGAIAIEIDIDSGQVYSAFYATRCTSLTYDEADSADGKSRTMHLRDYESRSDRMVGYYSVEDVANVVDLRPTRLKVTSLNLLNSETLSLNWSSNSRHNNLDIKFLVNFYQKAADEKKLFSTTISMADLREHNWSGVTGDVRNMALLELVNADGETSTWGFPLTYENGILSLVLDGIMSAEAMAALDQADLTDAEKLELASTSSTSITRLAMGTGPVSEVFANPQDIYATVQAESTYLNMPGDESEYRISSVAESNTANTMYADGAEIQGGNLEAKIETFRHLSNMRYCDRSVLADFVLNNKKMDWDSVGVGLYDYAADTESGSDVLKLCWKGNSGRLEFPSIEVLPKNHALLGSDKMKISNLKLGKDSVINDTTAAKLGTDASHYVGLFCEAEGVIQNLTLENPSMILAETEENGRMGIVKNYGQIRGVGIVAGRGQGILKNVSVTADQADRPVYTVLLPDRVNETEHPVAGLGGIAGVLAQEKENGELASVDGENGGNAGASAAENLFMSGVMTARLPDPGFAAREQIEDKAELYNYGIGGIAGYVDADKQFCLNKCENHADVSGNLATGGICGHMDDRYISNAGTNQQGHASLKECSNDGLILCTAGHGVEDNRIEGRYFGGIVGFGQDVMVLNAVSASGRSSDFRYDVSKRDALLKGQYVGGILGYGVDSKVYMCSTGRGGYVLGSDYVGGIVGGLDGKKNNIDNMIDGGASVTTNVSYVIGNTYVGGIVGLNEENNEIIDCINNGVAAGYEEYVGGIVGFNGKGSMVKNCASYLSDYDSSIFNMIVNTWKATGDCTGGIAGYNNGSIYFDASSEKHTVKSVSSIVVGQDYVGGMVGFNDVQGDIDTSYALVGGRIHAYGDCAGGMVGFNASEGLLEERIVMKPQSVRGNYYVGGCIGANVVDLTQNRVMNGFSTDNGLGNLTARAFAGGLIGYHRSYSSAQLGIPAEGTMLEYLSKDEKQKNILLPGLDQYNVPKNVEKSTNRYTLTVTGEGTAAANNLTIQAQAFAGGIVGAGEAESLLVLRNCTNTGNLSLADANAADADGVNLWAYLQSHGLGKAANKIKPGQAVHMIGGVIGVNEKNHVVDHCSNRGSMTGVTGLGGIVGLNAGGVFNCELSGNFGNAGLDYVGGIAGFNVGSGSAEISYTDVNRKVQKYTPGTIADSSCGASLTISGRSAVGGITGYNLPEGVLRDNRSYSNITAAGDCVGGITGKNAGKVFVSAAAGTAQQTISSAKGQEIGGLVGYNEGDTEGNGEDCGVITISASSTGTEVIAVGRNVNVSGGTYAGGIVGNNAGKLQTSNGQTLVCDASQVRAYQGHAGGIAGKTSGGISNAVNRSLQVSADTGLAGGIVPENVIGAEITNCQNQGNVSSNQGYAGGITAKNSGIIYSCTVMGRGTASVLIRSRNVDECGAITAVNEKSGEIYASVPKTGVRLAGSGTAYGGIAGVNKGKICGSRGTVKAVLEEAPKIESLVTSLTVGGAAGRNESGALITDLEAQESFVDFRGYRYVGGITGENMGSGIVSSCSYRGTIKEGSSAAGNCYGGIAGDNAGTLQNCTIPEITMNIQGTYTATSTSTAEQKEKMASHAGAVAGKNEKGAAIIGCFITNNSNSSMTAGSGMLGGVAGYNKGLVSGSGDTALAAGVAGCTTIDGMCSLGASADSRYVVWGTSGEIENLNYSNSGGRVTANRMKLIVSSNGNLGGITAYNAPTGKVEHCASGNWYLNNKSNAIGVGTGGIIGMNESEKDQSFLLNQAFVGRQLKNGVTNRFAGGIIGNQNNTTKGEWNLTNSVNYGTVYCYNTHYSGGILGQWTGTGGTIENCRNYGLLQTTYQTGWVGASGGIVAQLYHAYENNDYNIISCGNFGNIFGRNGASTGDSANDSAGILGNVTNYGTSSVGADTRYTIRVLDCVNGPGVSIYSNSMASGIVGFFSSDDTGHIPESTANTWLVIERCRNFAAKLNGSNFVGGILGERYGSTGADHTILYDNFSVNPGTYAPAGYPIISYVAGNNTGNDSLLHGQGNYFFENGSVSFTNMELYQDDYDWGNRNEAGWTTTLTYNNVDSSQRRADAERVYVIRNRTSGTYILIALNYGETISRQWATIDSSTGNIIAKDTKKVIGKVLCSLDAKYTGVNNIIAAGNTYYLQVRNRYRTLEGLDASGTKLTKPASVTAQVANGRIHLNVIRQNDNCDPFKYEVEVLQNGTKIFSGYIYSESGSLTLPAGVGGNLSVNVRAVSMFPDVSPSDWISQDTVITKVVLPAPDIRAELEKDAQSNAYRYKFSLINSEEYDLYTDWKINVRFTDGTDIDLLKEYGYTGYIQGKARIQQIVAQALPVNPGDANLIASEEVPIPAWLPGYYPSISLAGTGNQSAGVSCEVSGKTREDLTVTVTLDARSSGMVDTPPIYRVELAGTWKNGTGVREKNVVFDSKDVLISANGTATAVFTGLGEYMKDASNMKVRIWYEESGLGPVYTWHEVSLSEEDLNAGNLEEKANVYELKVAEDGTEEWTYEYSTVLANNSKTGTGQTNYFNNYVYDSYNANRGYLFTWLPTPNILNVTDGQGPLLTPKYDADGNLCYTFYWDSGRTNGFNRNNSYEVELYGIDADDKRVAINTEGINIGTVSDEITGNGNTAYSITVNAEEWNYKKIEIQVTRVGNEAAHQIGLTSTGTFSVRQRLPKPAQPAVTNPNSDELDYEISWDAIAPGTGCGSYQIYVQKYLSDGVTLDTPVMLQEMPVTDPEQAAYKITRSLDDYAGEQVRIYVVAAAEADSESYVNSSAGVAYELKVLSRLEKPEVTFGTTWIYSKDQPLTMAQYLNGGLGVKVTAGNAASIPPGGSTYLLRAYVFDTAAAAQKAIADSQITGWLAEVPQMPMEALNAQNYQHTITGLSTEYAGKWLVFQTRISAGSGNISSPWTTAAAPVQLPYVRLNQVDVASERVTNAIIANVTTNPEVAPESREWSARQTGFSWNSVEHADAYYIDITERMDTAAPGSVHQMRIRETMAVKAGETTPRPAIEISSWTRMADGTDQWVVIETLFPDQQGFVTGTLNCYQKEINSTYEAVTGEKYSYSITSAAKLQVGMNADGKTWHYILTLPDTEGLSDTPDHPLEGTTQKYSQLVQFRADVCANEETDPTKQSDAYVSSEWWEIDLTK